MEILNRKARYDYAIEDTYEAGIVLTGTEIKSVRQGKVNIKDSYAIIRNDEIYLLNTHISIYEEGNRFNHEEDRTRKLLLHKNELIRILTNVEKFKCTIIPLSLLWENNKIKLEIAVARRRNKVDKRQAIKEKDIQKRLKKIII